MRATILTDASVSDQKSTIVAYLPTNVSVVKRLFWFNFEGEKADVEKDRNVGAIIWML
jgi:hypothetical protein